ncbi:glycosyltransferase 87 family protein [Streptomyces sp. SL13]|uniref:Glycosyltransferase 87 family protein n=1 Tax=Streptantibioticus silvisoli TaxID=2705255 RepID=A0AA90HCE6_9ACTN|nr:glycosyltransferase 87 family protein [Streptantibioticus silvisoli]MDI5964803.1 glycosyltransferase 87 family protein [Streptantibioticus silvisoli]MDI5973145.1 glycosyltransferase 87 family protein [Streptantibioticus silvisoli]
MTATQPVIAAPRPAGVRRYVARRPTAVAAVACLLSFTAFCLAQHAARVSMVDLMVYRAEGWTVRTGQDLYAMVATSAHLPTTYPPFAALLFEPLSWMRVPEMRAFATVFNLGLLLAVVHLSLRLIGRPHRIPVAAATLATAAVAVWCEPVWTTLRYGQINLLLAVLVLWDLTRRSGHRWAGVGIGVAAGIKLTPALFAVFLALVGVVQGWRGLRAGRTVWNPALRRAGVALAAFATTAALAALALPADSRTFWTRMIFAANRVGRVEDTANQSVRGVLARLLHTTHPDGSWALAAGLVGLLGLAVAVAAALAGERLPSGPAWAACACATTALLVSPVSWSHHWVWCVPMVMLLASEAQRRRSVPWRVGAAAAAVVFCSFALWLVPHAATGHHELRQNAGQMLLSATYPLVGLVFLAVAGFQAVRALRTPWPVIPGQTGRTGGAHTDRGDLAYAD